MAEFLQNQLTSWINQKNPMRDLRNRPDRQDHFEPVSLTRLWLTAQLDTSADKAPNLVSTCDSSGWPGTRVVKFLREFLNLKNDPGQGGVAKHPTMMAQAHRPPVTRFERYGDNLATDQLSGKGALRKHAEAHPRTDQLDQLVTCVDLIQDVQLQPQCLYLPFQI